MTDNLQPTGSVEALDQRAEWSTPEVVRMNAGGAEASISGSSDDGSVFIS